MVEEEYVLWLESKGRYGPCVQVKLCDPIVTHGPYLSTLELLHDKALYKFKFTYLLTYLYVNEEEGDGWKLSGKLTAFTNCKRGRSTNDLFDRSVCDCCVCRGDKFGHGSR